MYFDLKKYKQDPAFESDSDYYLNSIEAAQNFYLSFQADYWNFGSLRDMPVTRYIVYMAEIFRWLG